MVMPLFVGFMGGKGLLQLLLWEQLWLWFQVMNYLFLPQSFAQRLLGDAQHGCGLGLVAAAAAQGLFH